MKNLITSFAFLVLVFTALSARPAKAHVYYPPYVYNGYVNGIPSGYGFFHFNYWPTLLLNSPYGYGYTYYPGFYYQPYYATYATIVYSVKEDKSSGAWGANTLSSAVEAAKAYCTSDDCLPVVWVQGGCAAIAVNKEDRRLNWAYAGDRHSAVSTALRLCRRGPDPKECVGRGWVCSF